MILSLMQWVQNTDLFTNLRASAYAYPIVLALHLTFISLFGGMIFLTDLRLLGWALKRIPETVVINALRIPKRIGFLLAATFGILLFCCKAEQYYYNVFFRIKLLLFVMVAVHALVFRKVYHGATASAGLSRRVSACLSLLIWAGILTAGRNIGYVPPRPGLHMSLLERHRASHLSEAQSEYHIARSRAGVFALQYQALTGWLFSQNALSESKSFSMDFRMNSRNIRGISSRVTRGRDVVSMRMVGVEEAPDGSSVTTESHLVP